MEPLSLQMFQYCLTCQWTSQQICSSILLKVTIFFYLFIYLFFIEQFLKDTAVESTHNLDPVSVKFVKTYV